MRVIVELNEGRVGQVVYDTEGNRAKFAKDYGTEWPEPDDLGPDDTIESTGMGRVSEGYTATIMDVYDRVQS